MSTVRRLTLLLIAPAIIGAQTTIATPAATATSAVRVDDRNEFSIGQTFRPPTTDTRLDQFSFWVRASGTGTFSASVFAWDDANSRASGPALFTSAPLTFPVLGTGLGRVDVNTGGLALTAGQQYVAFLRLRSEVGSSVDVLTGILGGNTYADGNQVSQLSPTNAPAWTTRSWTSGPTPFDLQFALSFNTAPNVVPEPSTYALMATGLVGLAGMARRRRCDRV